MSEGAKIRARLQGCDAFHWFEAEHGDPLTDRDLEGLEERALAIGITLEVALQRTRDLFAAFPDMASGEQRRVVDRIIQKIQGSLH